MKSSFSHPASKPTRPNTLPITIEWIAHIHTLTPPQTHMHICAHISACAHTHTHTHIHTHTIQLGKIQKTKSNKIIWYIPHPTKERVIFYTLYMLGANTDLLDHPVTDASALGGSGQRVSAVWAGSSQTRRLIKALYGVHSSCGV